MLKVETIIVFVRNKLLGLMRVMVRRGGSGSLVKFRNAVRADRFVKLDNEIEAGEL